MGTSALYFSACGLQRLAQLQGIAAQHLGGGLLARPAQRNAIVCMARHHMQVKVKNGLIALAAIGLQQRQPRWVEDRLRGTGDPLGRLHDGRRLVGGDVQQGGRMAFGGHEHMAGVDLADYLVKKGLPFRDAHETVAHAVKAATSHACDLSELPLAVLQSFHPAIEKDVYEVLSLRGSLNARNTLGGTAPAQVRTQLARHRARLAA